MADKGGATIFIYLIIAVILFIVISPIVFGGWVLVIKMIQFMNYSPGGFPIWAVVMLALVALVIWRRKVASAAYI